MIKVKPVITKKDRKKFVDFPTKLYKDEKNYVHSLRSDELKLLTDKNPNIPDVEFQAFLAYKDNKIVGRILVMEHFLSDEKFNQKYARFTRFDTINDLEVAKALFNTAEKWAKDRGLEYIQGPLGFNDLDKEGLLVEGFEYQNTFAGVYNFPYYDEILKKCGYKKEVDWLEFRIYPAKKIDEKVDRVANMIQKRYGYQVLKIKSKRKFLKEYKEEIFDCIDDSYSKLLGTVPLNDKVKEETLSLFKMFLNLKFLLLLLIRIKK